MRVLTSQSVRLPLGQHMVVALIATATCGAWAEDGDPNPYYIGVKQTAMHDSNVFRIPDGIGDYYTSTGVFGGFDQRISRQRLYASANAEYNNGLNRVALKMATGSGKTVVMAMLIAWQTANKVTSPRDARFSKRFLLVTPGITIRDRLRVLIPNDPGNYYDERELLP